MKKKFNKEFTTLWMGIGYLANLAFFLWLGETGQLIYLAIYPVNLYWNYKNIRRCASIFDGE